MSLLAATFVTNAFLNFAFGILLAKILGPQDFGSFAVAMALAVFLNAFFIEWVRQAAVRFYIPALDHSAIKTQLGKLMVLSTGVIAGFSALLWLVGLNFKLSGALFAAAIAAAVGFGWFDFRQSMLRTENNHRAYAGIVFTRNALTLFAIGAAWWLGSPAVALGGLAFSAAVAAIAWHGQKNSDSTTDQSAKLSAATFAKYAMPLVAAVILYALLTLVSRAVIAQSFGAAEAGKIAFASDIGFKLLCTVSAVVELVFLAKTVAIAETEGRDAALRKAAWTMTLGLAIIAPLAAGYFAVLPAFSAVIAPDAFRDSFSHYTVLLMPTFLALSLAQACVTPILVVEKMTMTAGKAALAGLLVGVIGLSIAPSVDAAALAVSAGYATGFVWVAIAALKIKEARPKLRDIVFVVLAAGIMAAVLWPFRHSGPPLINLPMMAVAGVVLYAALIFAFNVAGVRQLTKDWLKARRS